MVALVIMIIILLILAGITLAGLSGENGILRRAGEATEETKKAQYTEIINTIIMEKQIEESQNPNKTKPFIEIVAEAIREKDWVESAETCDDKENYDADPRNKTKIIVETTDGYEIIVNIDNDKVEGEVVSITKGKAGKWKVEFNANGGTGTTLSNIERRKGFSIEMPTGEGLTNGNKKIVGWSENARENPKEDKFYKVGERYIPTKDTTLYAVWDEYTIQVTFDKNTGDSGEMPSINISYGESRKLPANKFEKEGYNFIGWNTSPEGTEIEYPNEASVNLTQNTTLYAIWKEDIVATLNITNNKFTEGTKITLGGKASVNGIQKVELKVGDNILYAKELYGSKEEYLEKDLGLESLTGLEKLNFYDINVVLEVTSTTGNIGSTNVGAKNYTVSTATQLNQFASIVSGLDPYTATTLPTANSLAGENIIQLANIVTTKGFCPVGYAEQEDPLNRCKYFAGTYDGKGHSINVTSYTDLSQYGTLGVFGIIKGGTVRNLSVLGAQGLGNCQWYGGIVGIIENGTIDNCRSGVNYTQGKGDCRGGICSIAKNSTIKNCGNTSSMYFTKHVGGIIGRVGGDGVTNIYSCYNSGAIYAYDKGPQGASGARRNSWCRCKSIY